MQLYGRLVVVAVPLGSLDERVVRLFDMMRVARADEGSVLDAERSRDATWSRCVLFAMLILLFALDVCAGVLVARLFCAAWGGSRAR